jgi:hypothetical protein
MTEKKVLDFKPTWWLEQIGYERCKQSFSKICFAAASASGVTRGTILRIHAALFCLRLKRELVAERDSCEIAQRNSYRKQQTMIDYRLPWAGLAMPPPSASRACESSTV